MSFYAVLRRNVPAAFVLGGAVVSVSAVLVDPSGARFVIAPIVVGMVFVSGVLVGKRESYREFAETLGRLPARIHVHETEDGRVLALVEQASGDVLSIAVPEEDSGEPEAIVRYILRTIEEDGE